MSCCGQQVTSDVYSNCCNANELCHWNGDYKNVTTAPIYVQQVYDAIAFHMQGMKSITNQTFEPAIPAGYRVKKVIDIKVKRFFNPENVEDCDNLTVDLNTSISGATFLKDKNHKIIEAVGPDGFYSERILYADTSECDENCQGTPVFGTQSICVFGKGTVELELLLCDGFNNETCYTVCAEVEIGSRMNPLVLSNFFEICMPSTFDSAFFPRFTEFSNTSLEGRLATNNCGRDLAVDPNGIVSANLILAICVNCEKKVVVPVQICVLSTGYVVAPVQQNSICTSFPSLFPEPITVSGTERCLEERDDDPGCDEEPRGCGCGNSSPPPRPKPRR